MKEPTQTRIIKLQRRSLSGQVSVKGAMIPFESSLERDFLILCDFDVSVLGVIPQPYRIHYQTSDNKRRRYTPDFFVRHSDESAFVYEVKYREELKENWSLYKDRFKAARRFCKQNGSTFKIITEREIRETPHLYNAKFLRQYQESQVNAPIESHLVKTLKILGDTTPQALIEAAYHCQEWKMKALPSLWRMLALGLIGFSSTEQLSMYTPIWLDHEVMV